MNDFLQEAEKKLSERQLEILNRWLWEISHLQGGETMKEKELLDEISRLKREIATLEAELEEIRSNKNANILLEQFLDYEWGE